MKSYLCLTTKIITLLAVALLCIGLSKDVDAGKGKGGRQGHIIIQNEVKGQNLVPIYMPIPIPVPMPMGPSGEKFRSHQQQQQQQHHQHEGQGEVKKIYLLQPMPRVQPQPKLKGGGFMGPVQTNIHMSSPVMSQHRLRPHGTKSSHDGDEEKIVSKGQQSDLKILPIVVIPPIAPMPPIQIPQSNVHSQKASMTPQFNNYIVSGSERRKHHNNLYDHRSFSDYGESGAKTFQRESQGSSSRLRTRQAAPMRHDNWIRVKAYDETGDDYDINFLRRDPSRLTGRGRQRFSSGGRDGGRLRMSTNSIRDILDNQAYFDEDYQNDMREVTPRRDCCGGGLGRKPIGLNSDYQDIEPKETSSPDYGGERDQYETRRAIRENTLKSNQYDLSSDVAEKDLAEDRDYNQGNYNSELWHNQQDQNLQVNPRYRSRNKIVPPSKRLYLDTREILQDDDEWRFDSVKSITHASPNATTDLTLTNAPLPLKLITSNGS